MSEYRSQQLATCVGAPFFALFGLFMFAALVVRTVNRWHIGFSGPEIIASLGLFGIAFILIAGGISVLCDARRSPASHQKRTP